MTIGGLLRIKVPFLGWEINAFPKEYIYRLAPGGSKRFSLSLSNYHSFKHSGLVEICRDVSKCVLLVTKTARDRKIYLEARAALMLSTVLVCVLEGGGAYKCVHAVLCACF